MDVRTLLVGDYIDAVMLKGRKVTRTIKGGDSKPLESLNGKVKTRWVIEFEGSDKKFPLNTTNTKCVMQMFGPETDDWAGKRITLYPEKNSKSESGEAIRIWGSPDIPADVSFTTRIGKTNRTFTMHKVGANREPGED